MSHISPVTHDNSYTRQVGTLVESEKWWRDHYLSIETHGYKLRPRYHPDWEPSWIKTGKVFYEVEDGQVTISRAVMDAVCVRDGLPVMLKRVLPNDGPHELMITRHFSSAELANTSHNHCVPLLDIIELQHAEHQKLMVTPLLRPFNQPPMQTFGEFVAFFTQICNGLQFMHQRNVAHRDCTANNIMLDPSGMYPNWFHPVKIDRNRNFKGTAKAYTRTQRPPVYYFTDFGLSRQYTSRDVVDEPFRGEDKSAPEHRSGGGHCNPFHTDIYYIGNLVREEFMNKYRDFEFMKDLIDRMTHEDPAMRPRIEEVLRRFASTPRPMSGVKLRPTITTRQVPKSFELARMAKHTARTLCCAAQPSHIFSPEHTLEATSMSQRSR